MDCHKCGKLIGNGTMGTVLPLCQCEWHTNQPSPYSPKPIDQHRIDEVKQLRTQLTAAQAEIERLKGEYTAQRAAAIDNKNWFDALKADCDKLLQEREEREAVGTVMRWNQGGSGEFVSVEGEELSKLPHGTKLYTRPPVPAVKGGWIRVEDRLPITEETMNGVFNVVNVIAFDGATVFHTEYKAGRNGKYWGEFGETDITHWMPLPAAPKE